uniref:8.9 kDa family member n=1 Tax=Rhipicephalus zambeziensis TaxID=60191 RepID=A0A224Y725_9ACAR
MAIKMSLHIILMVFILCGTFMELETKKDTPSEKRDCKTLKAPRPQGYVPCTVGNTTIDHGKTKPANSRRCFGYYCWNGTVTPIECRISIPLSNENYTYKRQEGTWPRCCYWVRTCT